MLNGFIEDNQVRWSELLKEAVEKPGLIHQAYSAFRRYSLGNQLLALVQCLDRKIEPGPIASYNQWRLQSRYVRKNEKGLMLCRPVQMKKKARRSDDSEEREGYESYFTRFIFRRHWFVLAQTEGEPFKEPHFPLEWNKAEALGKLQVQEETFDHVDGNVQGYCTPRFRKIAINPLNPFPEKTLFHELGHLLLGHHDESEQKITDPSGVLPKKLCEVEAESVALLCLESLKLSGSEFCRGYIQGWLGSDTIPERSAQRIFNVTNAILQAGRTEEAVQEENQPEEERQAA